MMIEQLIENERVVCKCDRKEFKQSGRKDECIEKQNGGGEEEGKGMEL